MHFYYNISAYAYLSLYRLYVIMFFYIRARLHENYLCNSATNRETLHS